MMNINLDEVMTIVVKDIGTCRKCGKPENMIMDQSGYTIYTEKCNHPPKTGLTKYHSTKQGIFLKCDECGVEYSDTFLRDSSLIYKRKRRPGIEEMLLEVAKAVDDISGQYKHPNDWDESFGMCISCGVQFTKISETTSYID